MNEYTPDVDGLAAKARDIAAEPEPEAKQRPVERFAVKVATLMDGPCVGQRVRPKGRAILVPFAIQANTEANPTAQAVVMHFRYRRAPGRLPDGSQRYIHVDREGAW